MPIFCSFYKVLPLPDERGLAVPPHQALPPTVMEAVTSPVTSPVTSEVSWAINTFIQIQLLNPNNDNVT